MPRTYAIVSALFLPHMGGVENFTANLAAELAREGNRVIVVTSRATPEAPAKERRADGVEVWRLPAHMLLDGRLPLTRKNAEWRRMLAELAGEGIDRMLVNTRFYQLSLAAAQFAAEQGIPCVVLDHGSSYLGFGDARVDWAVRAYERMMTERIKLTRAAYCGISERSVEWLRHWGIEAKGVIHNAIDAQDFRACASSRDFRAELGVLADELLVAFTGRLVATKGVRTVLEAAKLLEGKGVRFAIAGDGPERAYLEQNAPSNLALLGSLGREDISALLGASDVFLFPSETEGLPTSLLEAAAQGLYIVSTDVGGVRDVVPGVEYGAVVPALSAHQAAALIAELAQNRARIAEAGAKVRDHVEQNFSWAASAHALDNLEW